MIEQVALNRYLVSRFETWFLTLPLM